MPLTAAVLLVVVLGWLGTPAPQVVPRRTDLRAAWSRRHHGITPTGPAALWLRGIHAVAPRLARRRPMALTAAGLWCAFAAAVAASSGQRAVGAVLLLLGAVLDGLDGAVAEVRGEVSRRGARADAVADRGADAALLAGLGVLGAPVWSCAAAFAAVLAQEGLRRRSTRITPGERPIRVVLGVAGFLLWPTAAAVALLVLTALSAAALARPARR